MEILIKKMLLLEFRMEQDPNHQMPYIHINYGRQKHVASYSIKDSARLAGNLDRKYDIIVKNWINEHTDKLLQIWEQIQKGNQKYELLIKEL